MVKHRFEVVLKDESGRVINSTCIAYQIEDACKLYRNTNLNLQLSSVTMIEQVHAETEIGIETN